MKKLSITELNEYEKACTSYMKYMENQTDEYKNENYKNYVTVGKIRNEIFERIKDEIISLGNEKN